MSEIDEIMRKLEAVEVELGWLRQQQAELTKALILLKQEVSRLSKKLDEAEKYTKIE